MTCRPFFRATVAAALFLPPAGCLAYRGPRDVRHALHHDGVHLHREFGLKMGFLSTKLALGFANLASDEPLPIRGLSGVALAVYSVPPAGTAGSPRRHLSDLKLEGWDPVLRVRDRDGDALVLIRQDATSIRGLLFLVEDMDEGQVVVCRLRGRLERLFQGALREALDGQGHEGVEKAFPVVAEAKEP